MEMLKESRLFALELISKSDGAISRYLVDGDPEEWVADSRCPRIWKLCLWSVLKIKKVLYYRVFMRRGSPLLGRSGISVNFNGVEFGPCLQGAELRMDTSIIMIRSWRVLTLSLTRLTRLFNALCISRDAQFMRTMKPMLRVGLKLRKGISRRGPLGIDAQNK